MWVDPPLAFPVPRPRHLLTPCALYGGTSPPSAWMTAGPRWHFLQETLPACSRLREGLACSAPLGPRSPSGHLSIFYPHPHPTRDCKLPMGSMLGLDYTQVRAWHTAGARGLCVILVSCSQYSDMCVCDTGVTQLVLRCVCGASMFINKLGFWKKVLHFLLTL